MFFSFITRQRHRYAVELFGSEKYWSLSAQTLSGLKDLKIIFSKYVKGKLLDAGAGQLNCKFLLVPLCSEYKSLDKKNCVFCGKKILKEAKICKYCRKWNDEVGWAADDVDKID